jgi:hydroxymethylbilane synthase
MQFPLRIGTRASPLALAQASMVADALRAAHGWKANQVLVVPMTTTGDRIKDVPLAEFGGKALWTKELDRALLDGKTDCSVHSMKDVETIRPTSLVIVATLPRADTRDRLIGVPSLDALPPGARIGTSSPRRAAQLLRARPDCRIVAFRGNVARRLARLEEGEAEATLLAAAGLDRLGEPALGEPLDRILPAPAQGAVGVEVLAESPSMRSLIGAIDHVETHECVRAERRLLEGLGADCQSPVAALAILDQGMIRLRAEILTLDGSESVEVDERFAPGDVEAPLAAAEMLLSRAGPNLRRLFTGGAPSS